MPLLLVALAKKGNPWRLSTAHMAPLMLPRRDPAIRVQTRAVLRDRSGSEGSVRAHGSSDGSGMFCWEMQLADAGDILVLANRTIAAPSRHPSLL